MSNDIDVHAVSEALNDKADRDFHNIEATRFDYVVDYKAPTVNDPTWYRLYNSGWVEQGGRFSKSANPTYVSFPKAMANTIYHINCSFDYNDSNSRYEKTVYVVRETNRMGIYMGSYNAQCTNTDVTAIIWEVKGFAA